MSSRATSEDLWDVLNHAFTDLAVRLKDLNARLTWTIGHRESEAFPFTGYISFSRDGTPGQEDLVLSVGVQRKAGQLLWITDLASGDGEVLAEGPSCTVEGAPDLARWVAAPLADTLSFLREVEPLLAELLS